MQQRVHHRVVDSLPVDKRSGLNMYGCIRVSWLRSGKERLFDKMFNWDPIKTMLTWTCRCALTCFSILDRYRKTSADSGQYKVHVSYFTEVG